MPNLTNIYPFWRIGKLKTVSKEAFSRKISTKC